MWRLTRGNKHLVTARNAIDNRRPLVGFCTLKTQDPVQSITTILGYSNWKHLLDNSDLHKQLNKDVIRSVIHMNRAGDPKLLLDFYLWSEEKVGILKDLDVLSIIAVALCNSKFYETGRDVIFRMIRICDGLIASESYDESIEKFDVFKSIDKCYREFDRSNPMVFEMLLICFKRTALLEEILDAIELLEHDRFVRAADKGYVPSLLFCNMLLRDLLKADQTKRFWKLRDTMSKIGLSFDAYTYSIVIHAYVKLGSIDTAKKVLLEMGEKGYPPDVVTYSSVIYGLCRAGRLDEAAEIKSSMIDEGLVPDSYTYSTLINAYCTERRLEDARLVLLEMLDAGLKPDAIAYRSLIDGFGKQGNVEEAFKIKNKLISHGIQIGLALLNGASKAGMMENAREIVTEMVETDTKPDSTTYNSLIEGYYRKRDMVSAFQMLDEMKKRNVAPTIHTYSAIINGLYLSKSSGQAKAAFGEMLKQGLEPNAFVYTIISAHDKKGKLKEARRIFDRLRDQGILQDVFCYNSLIISLCQIHKMKAARTYLDDMLNRGLEPDALTYEAFVDGYSKAGKMQMADKYFNKMVASGLVPNHAPTKVV
ncbi:hypothetical protein FNV43_RR12910 [Rhamnella rubrinervis]|uniref:Pentatricopeptide repeat-containing protein n=1 Tax=Rhamnella rubrinervis TaxID=2594499 RepID=A0A8K0MEK0_9ROSA|nr:hypothetical protein FNV43_RR12910 [Rhamnella rubrinervis]